ncbi:hypothetical protein FQA39_LY08140 [Lamprigera yunnana]|nr:hypothetical protein FQA39_LY08140 [Lamprigera yunnana]
MDYNCKESVTFMRESLSYEEFNANTFVNMTLFLRKEKELEEEYKKTQLDILGITETKQKGRRRNTIGRRPSIDDKDKAQEEVGCVIRKVYGPVVDEMTQKKDELWEQLTVIIEEI